MKTLQLIFGAGNGTGILQIAEPKDDLTLAEVTDVADIITARSVFANTNGVYDRLIKAQIIERIVTPLE